MVSIRCRADSLTSFLNSYLIASRFPFPNLKGCGNTSSIKNTIKHHEFPHLMRKLLEFMRFALFYSMLSSIRCIADALTSFLKSYLIASSFPFPTSKGCGNTSYLKEMQLSTMNFRTRCANCWSTICASYPLFPGVHFSRWYPTSGV